MLDPKFVETARESKRQNEAWMKGPALNMCMWLQPWLKPDDK